MRNRMWMNIGIIAALCGLALFVSCFRPAATDKGKALICHVGGTMRPVLEKLAEDYEAQTGRKIEINAAGSGELLAHIEMQKFGDVYVCHDPFLDILMQKKLGVDGWTIAELTPVIIVQKGNPKNVHGLKDLSRDDVSVILTDYKLSTLGRMLPTIFGKAGIDFAELNEKKKIITNKSGSYAANYVQMKNADVGMVWRAVQALREDDLDAVEITEHLPIPFVDTVTSATDKKYRLTPVRVTVASLTCAGDKDAAADFAQWLTSTDVARILAEYGFTIDPKIIKKEYEAGKKIADTPVGVVD